MESVGRVTTMGSWVCQQWNDVFHFDERAGPAMRYDQRQRRRSVAWLVDKVDI
ncbi:hypothetical protein NKH34_12865 [Mesorhizobium sp. M1148]